MTDNLLIDINNKFTRSNLKTINCYAFIIMNEPGWAFLGGRSPLRAQWVRRLAPPRHTRVTPARHQTKNPFNILSTFFKKLIFFFFRDSQSASPRKQHCSSG